MSDGLRQMGLPPNVAAVSFAAAELIECLPERARSSLLAFLHLTSEAPDRAVVDISVTGCGKVRLLAAWSQEDADATAA